jgi:hypothetical protein
MGAGGKLEAGLSSTSILMDKESAERPAVPECYSDVTKIACPAQEGRGPDCQCFRHLLSPLPSSNSLLPMISACKVSAFILLPSLARRHLLSPPSLRLDLSAQSLILTLGGTNDRPQVPSS